jgi:hypothetical protein
MNVDQHLWTAHQRLLAAAELAIRFMFDDVKPDREEAARCIFDAFDGVHALERRLEAK